MAALPQPAVAPLPAEVTGTAEPAIDLNDRSGGAWEFLPGAHDLAPALDAPCQDLDATSLPAEGWVGVAVPSELAMQGFDIRNNVEHYYRRTVSVPADYAGRRVLVRFDGVYSAARVWADGRLVGAHVGGFTTWDCDVTEVARPGGAFELVVGVADVEGSEPGTRNPEGLVRGDASWASCYAHHNVGGILRDVTLVALPAAHLVRLSVETVFDGRLVDATLRVRAVLSDPAARLSLLLRGPDGEDVARAGAVPAADGTLDLELPVASPRKWDAEHPVLYLLEASVERDGSVVERVRERVGFREVTYGGARGTAPNRVYVNGREVKLRGVCRHDVSDRFGRSTTREEDFAEVAAYRDANVNHVRTSHYPPSRHFLEACDELGMYVEEETSVCFQGTGGKGIHATADEFVLPTAEMVERDRNHPSVIIWSVGNESAFDRTPGLRRAYDHVKRADTTRPVIFSYPYTVETLPLPYDIISRHYESTEGFLGDSNLPVLHDEFAHVPCYDMDELRRDPNVRSFWGHNLRRAWERVFKTPGALGCDLWSAIDDVFPLPEGVGARWQRHSRGAWPGYGEWGAILDCHRRPKPEAFLVRKAFSPVRVDERRFHVRGDELLVPVANWFDHTPLSELRLAVTVDGRPSAGAVVPDVAPHDEGLLVVRGVWEGVREVGLSWSLAGRVVDEQVLALAGRPEPASAAGRREAPALDVTPDEIRVSCANGACYRFSRRTGLLDRAEAGGRVVLTGGPWLHLTGVELSRPWTVTHAPWAAVEGDHVTVVLQGRHGTRVPLQFVCRVFGDGRMDVSWHTRETNLDASRMSEMGVAFDLPDDVDAVSWLRDAPYARYPEGHIARGAGTARRVCPEALAAGYGALPSWPWEQDMFDAYLTGPEGDGWRVATSDFKALRENIRSYTVHFSSGEQTVSALSDGRAAARVELSGRSPRLVIDQQWWYPQLGWGNDCGRPVSLVEGTGRGEASVRVEPGPEAHPDRDRRSRS